MPAFSAQLWDAGTADAELSRGDLLRSFAAANFPVLWNRKL